MGACAWLPLADSGLGIGGGDGGGGQYMYKIVYTLVVAENILVSE